MIATIGFGLNIDRCIVIACTRNQFRLFFHALLFNTNYAISMKTKARRKNK